MNRMGGNSSYLEIIRLRVHELAAFPLELLGQWTSFPLTMLIFYVVYGAIYQNRPDFGGISFDALILYLSIALAYRKMGDAMGQSREIQEEIKKGEIFMYLTRPISYFGARLSKQIGYYITQASVVVVLLYVFAYFLGNVFLPIDRFLLGFALAMIGSVVIFQLYFIIGLLSFWFEEVWGFERAIFSTAWLLSGSAIPTTFFPPEMKIISFLLPFQHQAGVPAQFTLGQIGINVFAQSFIVLIFWIIALNFVQNILWKKGLLKNDGKG